MPALSLDVAGNLHAAKDDQTNAISASCVRSYCQFVFSEGEVVVWGVEVCCVCVGGGGGGRAWVILPIRIL